MLLTPAKIDFLRLKVGPLLRFAANVDVSAESFTNKVERLKLQTLRGSPRSYSTRKPQVDISAFRCRK
ncbi:MAG TPA: hypothetical protein VGI40_04990 [Pirellulaceae bacterium]